MRIDRGRDFLSKTVLGVFGVLDTEAEVLPAYSPHLKGTVENLNRCADRMLFALLPGSTLTPEPRRAKKKPDPDEPVALTCAEFTAEVLDRARWWNTEHRPARLAGQTPSRPGRPTPRPSRTSPRPPCGG
ncbi:hypothetical protein [Streptomyces sp. NPDC048623]|uniref:hypothetical protein n=1 Tax=Streptomyces sp. NPDC048623 TaxID=3155761 RepID=UPI003426E1EE